MRLSVLVVDDEPIAREGLKLLLGRQPQVESVSEARNGREAIALIREQRPDLVLLDVQMPRTDGFAVVHAVGAERMPPIIFVTAHDQYAIRAFEIAAIDYLLKPVTEEVPSKSFRRQREKRVTPDTAGTTISSQVSFRKRQACGQPLYSICSTDTCGEFSGEAPARLSAVKVMSLEYCGTRPGRDLLAVSAARSGLFSASPHASHPYLHVS